MSTLTIEKLPENPPKDGTVKPRHHPHVMLVTADGPGPAKLIVSFASKTGLTFYSYSNLTEQDVEDFHMKPLDQMGSWVVKQFVRNKDKYPYKNITDKVTTQPNGDATVKVEDL